MLNLGIIGGGNMGAAIISRAAKKYKIFVCEKDSARADLLKKKYRAGSVGLKTLAAKSDVIILAVKPQDMEAMLSDLKNYLEPKTLIVSIAAGLTTRFFEKYLGGRVRVIRAMPNMPALIGEGVTALAKGKFAMEKDLATARAIFTSVGEALVVDESLMDAVTAVSGSGPAYVFLFVESFLNAAIRSGLKPDVAEKLVRATLLGSAHLLARSPEKPGELRAKVTSKGGTTQAAMDVFLDSNFQKMFTDAVQAARARAKQLAK